MNGKKKLRKRITAFLMTLVMVMTLVMSVEPMRVRAATTTYKSGEGVIISKITEMTANPGIIKTGDIFCSGSYIKPSGSFNGSNTLLQIKNSSNNNAKLYSESFDKEYTFEKAMKVTNVNFTYGNPARYDIFCVEVQLQATVSPAPTAASLTYTGSAQALLSSGGSPNNGTMAYALGNSESSAPADNEFSTTIPTGTNVGTYYVWYMAKGTNGYSDSEKKCKKVTIDKATPTASMIPAAPTASAVVYGTKLSAVTLSNNWSWVDANASSIVPNVENSGYVAKYNGSIDTSNYDWTKYSWNTAPGWSFNSTTNKIQKTVVVKVNPIPKLEASFTVPTNLSATYDSSKKLSEQISLPDNWAWENGSSITPQVSDTAFTAVYTVPSPDNKNYNWERVNGYANNGDTITITRDLPVTINKATQTATVNMGNYDFGGNISTPTITGVQETPTVTYYYNTENSNEGGTEWKDMTSTTLDKGTYYMYATLSATDNYAAYTTPTVSFTVNPKTMTGITVQSVDVTYDGAEHRITVSGYPEGATVSYGESEGTYDLTSSPAYKDARDTAYTVYFKITAKGYNDYTGSATVEISPKVAELSWGDTAFIYNGSVQTPSASVSNLCSTDTCTVTVTGGQKNYSDTDYTATATALSNSNYKLPVEEADRQTSFTIAQKELGITWGETEFTYNGGTQKPTATLAGVEDGDICNVTVSGEKTDVGTDYTATASIDNDNYKLPEDATKLFTISPKSLKADTVTVTLSGTGITGNVTDGYAFVWDGNRKSPVITVTDNETGSTLVYAKDFTVSGTENAKNIGTYYITLTGAGNYTNKVKITWKITKAIITPSVSLAGWVYGDTPNEPQIIEAEITGDVTYTYYKDEACTVKTTAADGATEDGGVPACAGSYYVKADVAETQNYEAVSTKTSFTISKKDVTVTPKSGQKKTYGEYDPELTYNAVLVGDDTLSGSLARAEGENVGSYSITQGTLANSNYNIIFTTGVTFSIEQKQLTDDMLSLDPVNYTYTGAMVSPTVCYHDDTTKVDGTNVTEADIEKYGAKESSDYGVYTIELEGKGNYKGNIYKQWCISPVQDVTVTYDGNSHKIAYTTGAGFDLKFKDADGNYTLTDVSEQTMPGVYRYDYRMIIDEETIDGYAVLTINKIPFVGTLNMAERIGYGETLRPSVTGCSSDGDITYYYKKQGQPNSAYTETKPVNVGNYTVKAVVDATATQAGGTLTKDFEITKGTLTPVNPDKAVYACRDNGTKSVTLYDSYNELDGVSYTLGDVTDDDDILADSSVSVSRTGEVSYTLTGSRTVDAEAVIKVIIKSTNYEDIIVDVTIGVDASVPVITGVTDGKTYCTAQTITVADDSLDKVEINGTGVTLTSENTYTLAATGTTYIIKATDRAGNSSTVTVTVNNGHTWQNNPVFTWNGYTSATAKFTCSVDANHTEDKNCTISHVTTPAKCLVDGKRVYTASVTVDGTTYTDTNPNEEVLTATGHHWVYDAEGDTLYAWCSGDCDYHGETKADAKSTLTIAATGATYDTEAYEQEKVSLKDKSGAAVTVGTFPVTGDALGTITYYLSDGITKTGTAADTTSGAAAEGAAPVNAGSYYAAITVSGKTAKAPFTIGKAQQSVGVSMDSYDFGGIISTPAIVDAQENPAVTYYYNTENSNQGGTEWKNMTAETLDKGTYYMYAVLAATDNYEAYTTPAVSFTVNPKTMTGIEAEAVQVVYDKTGHGISVSGYPTGATVTYGLTEDGCTLTSSPTFTDVSAEAYTVYYKITAKGHKDYTGSATVKITPKVAELSWSDTAFTYDGSMHTPTAAVSNLCTGDTCTVTVTGGQKDYSASAYTATATALDNLNYKLPDAETARQTEFTIGKKELGVTWSNTEFTYDQTAHKPTATLTGVVSGDVCNVTVTGEQTNAGTGYVATASIDNANYKIKTSDVTTTFVINPKEITEDMISLNDTDSIYDFTNSAITPVVTVKDGEVVLTGGETGDYVLAGDLTGTAYGSYEITVSGKGNYTGTPKVVWNITDPNAPTGEIVLKENKWNSFLNDITFGLFFKNTQQVTVNATDGENESGVDKVYYCVSDTLLTDFSSLDSATWKEISNGGSFNINPNAKVCVYVKIMDKAGNAAYISSKGIVVYTDSARDTDKLIFTRTSTEDVTASVTLNGNTISKVANGTTELTNGTHYTISEDGAAITFKASYLQTLSAGDYTIKVSYKPMGEAYVDAVGNDQPVDTSIALSVKRESAEEADTKITNKDKLSKEYDGQPTEAATPSSKNGSTPKVEYKKKGDPDSSFTEEVPKDAGDYVVRVTYPEDENYEETSATEEFTISPKAVTAVVTVSTKTYDKTTDAEVTATVDTGITGQTLTITGLAGTFDNKNAGTGKTVTINSTNAQVTAGAGTKASNYSITYPAESTGSIQAASLTIKVNDASKHIGKADPAFSYSVITGIFVEGDSISGITFTRTAGETAGTYDITATETVGSNPNYNITITDGTLTIEGHDWSGEWTIVKEATATTDGKRETICTRDGCGQRKYETIPATGTPEEPENPNAGKLDKDAEVEPDAQIKEATLDNKKSELLDAPAIFNEAEKQQIQSGTDARVWLEVKKTNESSIPPEDKKEVTKEAEKIMGENPMITYFDADLFKQVEGGNKTQIHEPGIDIQVTIKIPYELLNHDRTMVREYKIIRLHYDEVTGESKVDVLSGDFDRGTGEFSFKTDKFSTFAIAYTDIQLVTGITLTADSATLTGSGETVQLTATVVPDNAVNKNVIWTSSDPNVATVDANGKVAAVGNGTCTITATTEDGSFTAICTIKVEIPDSDNGGNNGDINSGDNNQSNEDANTPANTKEDKKPYVEAPKTGDASNVTLWSLLLALSALALADIRVARRKRSSSIEK